MQLETTTRDISGTSKRTLWSRCYAETAFNITIRILRW